MNNHTIPQLEWVRYNKKKDEDAKKVVAIVVCVIAFVMLCCMLGCTNKKAGIASATMRTYSIRINQ